MDKAKKALLSVLLILGIMVVVTQVTAVSPKEARVKTKPNLRGAIVRLYYNDSFGRPHNFCSATVITDKYILTAAHCVAGFLSATQNAAIEVRNDDRVATGTYTNIVGVNERADLAILIGDFSKFNKIPLSKGAGHTMDLFLDNTRPTKACGYPWGAELTCVFASDKRFTLFYGQVPGVDAAHGWLLPGMSGGPVIDMESGTIVGVNTGMEDGRIFFAAAVGLDSMFEIPVAEL